MNYAEFIRRAEAAAFEIKASGRMIFISAGNVTIRIDIISNVFAIRQVTKGNDWNYTTCTAEQASRALKLPRR